MGFQYEPLDDEIVFEKFIRDIFNAIHQTQSFYLYKTKGATQHGIDVCSNKKKIVIQCKKKDLSRGDKILEKELIKDFDESLGLVSKLPFGFKTFVLASNTKRYGNIQDYAAVLNDKYAFEVRFMSWKDIEEHISRHQEIREAYFPHLAKAESNLIDVLPNPEKLMEERESFIAKNDFKNAAHLSEKIVESAKTCGNPKLELKAHQSAALDLSNYFYLSNFVERERNEILLKISHHIDQFEVLGGEKGEVYSLRSHYYALRREPEKAFDFAQKAIQAPHKDDLSQGEAYILYLQALWGMNRSEDALSISAELENYQNHIKHHDIKLDLGAAYLRTLCKAGKVETIDVQRYLKKVQRLVERSIIKLA
ncbi:MAG: hypothetical protein PVH61_39695 [Candidatus Aminicenantes bacterium]|jgi:hypothetical protein